MKKTCLFLFGFVFAISLNAQFSTFSRFGITIKKKNSVITLCREIGKDSLVFNADTLYFCPNADNYLLFVNKGKIGLIEPSDFFIITKPKYDHFELIGDYLKYLLVKEKGKYQFLDMDTFEPYFNKGFDTIYQIKEDPHSYLNVVENKGKKGIVDLENRLFLVMPRYDKISFEINTDRDLYYIVEKAGKYGAGDREGLLLEPIYNEVKFFLDHSGYNWFLVKEKNKYGVISKNVTMYPVEFDNITFVGKPWPYGYMIMEKNGKFDVIDDRMPKFVPKYDKVWTEEKDGKQILSIEKDGNISTINL